jgi:putative ABC transport system permease protein
MSRIDDPEQTINMDGLYVDKDFLKTLDIRLLKGKSLSDYGNNFTGKVILNETALKKLGLKDPVGKKVDMGEIVGIVEDFHYHSFRKKIPPLMLMGNNQMVREVLIKTSGQNQEEIKEYINRTWEEFTGASRIETNYLTDNFDVLYKNERRLAVLITFFAGLAILIAAMGLLGLTIFTLKKRTKEIAIRKVNGARVKHILVLISMEYVSLIFYALLVSVPLSYYFLTRWLQDFAYKTNLSWWIFFVAGILGLIISLATISIKTIRAANRNPVESLRYE